MALESEELIDIVGGAAITGTLLNAITRFITTVYEWGRAIGSTISRMKNKNYCY